MEGELVLLIEGVEHTLVAGGAAVVPIQTNPGGYEMVAYVGLAAPVHRAAPIPKPAAVVPAFTG